MNSGELKAMIATSADFYGPRTSKTSVASIMIFEKMKNGKSAQWFVNANQPHSFTYTPDAAVALYMLRKRKCLWTNLAPSYCETCIDGQ